MRLFRNSSRVLSLVIILSLAGCGYSLHPQSSLPFKEIAIEPVENRTLEPGLQDLLHRVVTEEFMRQGISVDPSAKRRVSAVIRQFDAPLLSEKEDIAREYRITVGVDFIITDEEGQKTYIKNLGSPFMAPFAGPDDFGRLLASKSVATEEALRDVARQLIGSLIYK